jgi:hypothetical protein
MYLLLSRVLPFDDEDDREIARQTIYEPPDFSFHPWEKVSNEGKDLCKSKLTAPLIRYITNLIPYIITYYLF